MSAPMSDAMRASIARGKVAASTALLGHNPQPTDMADIGKVQAGCTCGWRTQPYKPDTAVRRYERHLADVVLQARAAEGDTAGARIADEANLRRAASQGRCPLCGYRASVEPESMHLGLPVCPNEGHMPVRLVQSNG